ncbi:MAG: hypothetical protein ACYDFT_00195 [Thermoplasmata archaeon]
MEDDTPPPRPLTPEEALAREREIVTHSVRYHRKPFLLNEVVMGLRQYHPHWQQDLERLVRQAVNLEVRHGKLRRVIHRQVRYERR